MGFTLGIEKVRRWMKRLNLVAKRPKQHRYPIGAPNRLNRQFNPEAINRYRSGDITFIRTGQGWLYLTVVMDLCSRRVLTIGNRTANVQNMHIAYQPTVALVMGCNV